MALHRIDYNAQPIEHINSLLNNLLGTSAKNLGIVKEVSEGVYEPTGN